MCQMVVEQLTPASQEFFDHIKAEMDSRSPSWQAWLGAMVWKFGIERAAILTKYPASKVYFYNKSGERILTESNLIFWRQTINLEFSHQKRPGLFKAFTITIQAH